MLPGQALETTEGRCRANLGDVTGLWTVGYVVQARAPAPRHGHQPKSHVRHAVLEMAEAPGQCDENVRDESIDGVKVMGQEVGQVMDGTAVPMQQLLQRRRRAGAHGVKQFVVLYLGQRLGSRGRGAVECGASSSNWAVGRHPEVLRRRRASRPAGGAKIHLVLTSGWLRRPLPEVWTVDHVDPSRRGRPRRRRSLPEPPPMEPDGVAGLRQAWPP